MISPNACRWRRTGCSSSSCNWICMSNFSRIWKAFSPIHFTFSGRTPAVAKQEIVKLAVSCYGEFSISFCYQMALTAVCGQLATTTTLICCYICIDCLRRPEQLAKVVSLIMFSFCSCFMFPLITTHYILHLYRSTFNGASSVAPIPTAINIWPYRARLRIKIRCAQYAFSLIMAAQAAVYTDAHRSIDPTFVLLLPHHIYCWWCGFRSRHKNNTLVRPKGTSNAFWLALSSACVDASLRRSNRLWSASAASKPIPYITGGGAVDSHEQRFVLGTGLVIKLFPFSLHFVLHIFRLCSYTKSAKEIRRFGQHAVSQVESVGRNDSCVSDHQVRAAIFSPFRAIRWPNDVHSPFRSLFSGVYSQALDINFKLIADGDPAIVTNGKQARSFVRFLLPDFRGNRVIKLTGLQLGPNYAKVSGTPRLQIQEHYPRTGETRVFAPTLINQDHEMGYIVSSDVVLCEKCFYRIDLVVGCKEQGSDQVWTKYQLPTVKQQKEPEWSEIPYEVTPCNQQIPEEKADASEFKAVTPLWDGPGSIFEKILFVEESRWIAAKS